MQVDILSDLHLDYYFPKDKYNVDAVASIFNPLFLQGRKIGDVLVIAGDIGHYNEQNIKVIKYFKDTYYKHVICVLGNHDYYILSPEDLLCYGNSFNRATELITALNAIEGVHCLDGNTIDIEGVIFGGTTAWYDGAYVTTKSNFQSFVHKNLKIFYCP